MEMTRDKAFEMAAAALEAHEPILAAELRHGCLNLHPNEPFFVLRAQDVTAAATVDHWVLINNTAPEEKLDAARDVADRMMRWGGPRKNAD